LSSVGEILSVGCERAAKVPATARWCSRRCCLQSERRDKIIDAGDGLSKLPFAIRFAPSCSVRISQPGHDHGPVTLAWPGAVEVDDNLTFAAQRERQIAPSPLSDSKLPAPAADDMRHIIGRGAQIDAESAGRFAAEHAVGS